MKTNIKLNKSKELEYPYIGISNLGIVILFSAPKVGTILYQDKYKFGIGYNIGDFVDSIAEEDFKPLEGKVILSN